MREILGGGNGRDRWPATWFACHKTVDYDDDWKGRAGSDTQHCAGVLIILHREGRPNDAMQIAERLHYWDPAKLELGAPVYPSTQAAIDGQGKPKSAQKKAPAPAHRGDEGQDVGREDWRN